MESGSWLWRSPSRHLENGIGVGPGAEDGGAILTALETAVTIRLDNMQDKQRHSSLNIVCRYQDSHKLSAMVLYHLDSHSLHSFVHRCRGVICDMTLKKHLPHTSLRL